MARGTEFLRCVTIVHVSIPMNKIVASSGCLVGVVIGAPVAPAGCAAAAIGGIITGVIAAGGSAMAYLFYTASWAVPQMENTFKDSELPESGPLPWVKR